MAPSFIDQPGFADSVRSVLEDLLGLPPDFMNYTVQYAAVNPLPIPASQLAGNPVTSVFGRTGAVAAATNDYTAAQVSNAADKGSSSAQAFSSAVVTKRVALTYGTSIATDASKANEFDITVTNGTAFTIANPTGLTDGQIVVYTIKNTSGGAVGTITWGTTFKLAAWTSPGTGSNRSIVFRYDGTSLHEIARTAADIAN